MLLCNMLVGYLGKSVLLLVWIPVSGLRDSDHILLTDLNCHGVLSTLWRGNTRLYQAFSGTVQL